MNIFSWFTGKGKASPPVDETKGLDTFTLNDLVSSTVTESKAMKIEAYFSCLRDKAETVGQLPLNLYRKNGMGREKVTQGRAHRIFTQQPCEYLDMIGFVEMATVTLERQGVFYAVVERNDRGSPMAVIPFYNQSSVIKQMDHRGMVYYTYTTNDSRGVITFDASDLFIIQLFTVNGVNPISPIVQCATMLGIAQTQDDNYKELQEDGITAQMALKTDQPFTDENALQRMKEDWKRFRGRNGKREIPILEQGLTPVSLKLTPQESELLSNRAFSVQRICAMTRVPPHRIGAKAEVNGTKSTVFELDEAYMMSGINPVLNKIEQAWNKIAPDGHHVEFDRKAFYRGSPYRLVEAVEREVKGGLANINEGRGDLGREPIEGGDVFAIDNNNVTYGKWTEINQIQDRLYGQANNQPQQQVNENEPEN